MAKKDKQSLFDRLFRRKVVAEKAEFNRVEPVEDWEDTTIDDNLGKSLRSLMREVYPEFKEKFDKYAQEGVTEFSFFRAYCSETGLLDNPCFEKLREFIKNNDIDCFGHEFEDAFIDVTQDFLREQAAQKEYEEAFKSVAVPAKNLPDGWEWVKFEDGSGSLNSPSGESYFSYDCISFGSQGGIEYEKNKSSGYSVFWGSFSEFVDYAENSIAKERGFLGGFDVSGIAGTMERNAWNGIEPTAVRLVAGDNIITLEGYVYEPHYEDFSATSSISFNGEVLFGVDSRNVDAYKNEVYQVGKFDSFEEAIDYIREQINVLELYLDESPVVKETQVDYLQEALDEFYKEAEEYNSSVEKEKSDNAIAFEK